jgi:hypothetical protein
MHNQCNGSVTFWYGPGSRVRGSEQRIRIRILLFSSFKTQTKNYYSAYYFLKVHLYHFPQMKSHKKSHKTAFLTIIA